MPTLFRKLVVIAAVDGLVLQPLHHRGQRGLKLDYKTKKLSASDALPAEHGATTLETPGIVGLLNIPPLTYLIAISGHQQVAQIRGHPVYVITDVALIPTASQSEAKEAIRQAKEGLQTGWANLEAIQSESEDSEGEEERPAPQDIRNQDGSPDTNNSPTEETRPSSDLDEGSKDQTTVAEDVIGRKGQYGRFADRWFSKKGWTAERRKSQGMSPAVKTTPKPSPNLTPVQTREEKTETSIDPQTPSEVTQTLLPKALRTTRMLFQSRSFFYSFDIDITRRLELASPKSKDLPLHKAVDPLYFWNRHLISPLTDGAHNSFILPIIQGFVGQKAFEVKKATDSSETAVEDVEAETMATDSSSQTDLNQRSKFLVTLISRRSVQRPGLRYVRRGVDDEGHTANSVETEQILCNHDWKGRVYSFTQVRGSIPLFFSQSPYSFKPTPVLQHSEARNQQAFDKHFNDLKNKYGSVQIVSLVDQSGVEAEVGRRYERSVQNYNAAAKEDTSKLRFEWFDFHHICRGMKFENVSQLLDRVGGTLDDFSSAVENNGMLDQKSRGVFRINCMDCLDRTNVVQSALAQRMLQNQLKIEGFEIDLQHDESTQWFNVLWADNGDAISKQYSSTAALKGDYTRTRRRNYRGAINDLGLTLSRYYNNIVNDFFSQAVIDFLLGNVNVQVFEDFEDKLMSGDPGMSIQKVRENAISTCTKIVIVDGQEELIGGWTMLSPSKSDTLASLPFEEVLLLLTDAALYKVRFDWNNEKVISFERVNLSSIIGLSKGVYITSTLASSQMNEKRNVGLVVKYRPGEENVARVNTRSLSTAAGLDPPSSAQKPTAVQILAFKAVPARSSSTLDGDQEHVASEIESVNSLCEDIKRAALGDVGPVAGFIEEKPIISLAEARKNTGLVDQLGHALKRLVWG